MVKYAPPKYNGDAGRVFVTGTSSSAMMTTVLYGSYPDVFAASAGFAGFAGVAFGCFAGNRYGVWSDACAKENAVKTGAEWAALVTAAYPGYSGFGPKMQVLHGTADTTLYPQNLQEKIKQWTAVLELSATASNTTSNTPVGGRGIGMGLLLRCTRHRASRIVSRFKRARDGVIWPDVHERKLLFEVK